MKRITVAHCVLHDVKQGLAKCISNEDKML